MWRNRFFILIILSFFPAVLFSQTAGDLSQIFSEAEKLHREYRFDNAIDKYNIVIETSADSLLRQVASQRVVQCENGIIMLDYSTNPTVIAKKHVALADFYLNFYDLGDKVWVLNPNPFVPLPHPYYQSIYKPKEATTTYYSAPDENGTWSIFRSSIINDTLWSVPIKLSENVNSSGDDIYPMISPDGKELYFASNGHYGMGGYDLYVSKWSSEIDDWSPAENLGFPFSSPANDIFFANSPDGRYSILVSDRNTSRPSEVEVFILAYDSTPLRKMIGSSAEAVETGSLKISVNKSSKPEEPVREVKDTIFNDYTDTMNEIDRLRSRQNDILKSIEEKRERYLNATNADFRRNLETSIAEEEINSLEIRDLLDSKILQAQQMEMDFITRGISPKINPSTENITTQPQEATVDYNYSFKNANFGYIGYITVLDPAPKVDYTFRVQNKAQVMEDSTLPEGLVYQIQLMVISTKATTASLKGLTPVFETPTSAGKYLYTVGVFRTRAEASSNLKAVHTAGFPSAFIIAYNDGKSITLNNARTIEENRGTSATAPKSVTTSKSTTTSNPTTTSKSNSTTASKPATSSKDAQTWQVVIEGYPETLPAPILEVIKKISTKDLARMEINGQNVYIVAPFTSQKEAETLINALKEISIDKTRLEPIKR